MKSYVLDNLVKCHCFNCNSEFILSEYKAEKSDKITCPYCQSEDIESYVFLNDKERLNELGCLGIGHHKDYIEEKYRYEMTWERIERKRDVWK